MIVRLSAPVELWVLAGSVPLKANRLVCARVQRISAYDRLTNAVREVVPDVMNTAASMDVVLATYNANGTALPLLFCVPILIKDNFDALDGKLP